MPVGCTRSHPHELMDDVCAEKAESARLRSALAEKTAQVERLRETLKQMQTSICGYAITSEESSIRLVHRFYETVRMHDELAREALAATADTPRPTCAWTYDDDTNSWDTECGEKWQFTDGGPGENGVRFCHGCGRPVRV